MEYNNRNIRYAIFRDSNLNQILRVSNFEFRAFSRTFGIDLVN